MNDKIYSGLDRAMELGHVCYRLFIERMASVQGFQPDWSNVDASQPVHAIVAYGRWIAECECGGAEFVEPGDPLFYCASCGNTPAEGRVRPVIFPDNRLAIEAALLERKVIANPGVAERFGTQGQRPGNRLIHYADAPRHWDGQTVDELRAEQKGIREVMAEMKKQRRAANG